MSEHVDVLAVMLDTAQRLHIVANGCERAGLTATMRKQAEQMDAAMSAVAELIEAATGLAYEHDALHGECACDGKRDCCACRLRAALAGTGAAAQAHRLGGLT